MFTTGYKEGGASVKAGFPTEGLLFARASLFNQWTYQALQAWSTSSALDRQWFTNEDILEPKAYVLPVSS